MVKAKKRGSGRGSGARREPATHYTPAHLALRRAQALLRKLSLTDLEAAIPVLQKYALHESVPAGADEPVFVDPGPPPDRGDGTGCSAPGMLHFDDVGELVQLVADLMAGPVGEGGDTCDATDLACFIHNEGEGREGVEAMLALAPIARRVNARLKHAERTAELQETLSNAKAAVEDKKQ